MWVMDLRSEANDRCMARWAGWLVFDVSPPSDHLYSRRLCSYLPKTREGRGTQATTRYAVKDGLNVDIESSNHMDSSVQVTLHFMLSLFLFFGRAKFIVVPFHHVDSFPIGNAPATTHSSSSCTHYS